MASAINEDPALRPTMLRRVDLLLVLLLAGIACGPVDGGSPGVMIPGIEGSQLGPALKGRVMIEEMNCVACHQADEITASSRRSPRLSGVGGRLNPDYLQAFIANPHHVKPGTLMPDLLAPLDPAERAAVAESITHYLVSRHKGAGFGLQIPDAVAAEQGGKLFHSVGCVACHSPRDAAGVEILPETSVPLGALETK